MTDQEERSDRKRARGNEYGHRFRIPLRRSNVSAQKGTPVSLEYLHNFGSGLPPALQSLVERKARRAAIEREEREKEGKRQKHTHSEENENWEEDEEAYKQEHAHRLMEEAHDQHGGAGNQEAEEDHERPPRTRRRIREAGSYSPDRGDPDKSTSDWYDEPASSDVGREAANSEAGLPWREGQLQHSSGGNEINPSHGERSAGSEVEEEKAVQHQEGELVPISTKTRTKTTTTKTTTKKNGTTITTVTKTTTKVSRKRFERR
ncbi:hypothetical protein CKAH01_07005 [Colletotrichum kahawae]|uniref:Uncharacterized protein n=1 Tax=Colletotrichum kahawae TaxID=34407 RepID=A0AAD9Y5X2_COLKA|nr:hypothetical protein CKAH01_07005 [Colletotrichum kahawae]